MAEIRKKSVLIIEHEKKFADALAVQVLDKPKLSIWMILIPIMFVFYFFQYQKFTAGQKMFAEHYLVSKKRALGEAVEAVNAGKEPDIDKLAKLSDMPEDARKLQAGVLAILVEHYITLLRSDGNDFDTLVRSVYSDRSNYLLFLNRLNRAEKAVNSALKPHLQKTYREINDTVSAIEAQSEKLGRENAENIFP